MKREEGRTEAPTSKSLARLFVQEIMNVHHGLNVLFGGFPTFPRQRIIKPLS